MKEENENINVDETQAEVASEEVKDNTNEGTANEENTEKTVEELLEEANAKIAELNDKYLRQVAEFDNYRRRVIKEKAELILNGGEKVLTEILPVIDDIERAQQEIGRATDIEGVKLGVDLIIEKFKKFLKSQGVEEIEAIGKDFDVNLQEAITMIPSPSDDMKGKVIDCTKKGYKLNDKVIRYAQVVVAE